MLHETAKRKKAKKRRGGPDMPAPRANVARWRSRSCPICGGPHAAWACNVPDDGPTPEILGTLDAPAREPAPPAREYAGPARVRVLPPGVSGEDLARVRAALDKAKRSHRPAVFESERDARLAAWNGKK